MNKWKYLLLLGSLLMLGSCYPQQAVVPPANTRISIYVSNGETERISHTETTSVECEVTNPETYTLPAIPNVSDIDDDDHEAIKDRLIAYIGELRTELRRVTCVDTVVPRSH